MAKRYGTEQNIHENPDQNPNFKIYISKEGGILKDMPR